MGFLCVLSYAFVAFILQRLLRTLYDLIFPYFIAQPKINLVEFCGAQWAVVTGSTDGIGKEYALQLADKGFDIVLVGRNVVKLNQTAKEIEKINAARKVIQIVFDFSDATLQSYEERIAKKLEGLDIGILVNNVGISYDYPEYYHKLPNGMQTAYSMPSVNCTSVSVMTHLVLEQMVRRNKGVVVNVSSASGLIPMPLLSLYSATKTFVVTFTRCLQKEYDYSGVVIQLVTPFLVATAMSKLHRPTFFAPSASAFVRSAIRSIGVQNNTFGCLPHAIQGFVLAWLPTAVADMILMRMHQAIRQKALKKKERDQKKD